MMMVSHCVRKSSTQVSSLSHLIVHAGLLTQHYLLAKIFFGSLAVEQNFVHTLGKTLAHSEADIVWRLNATRVIFSLLVTSGHASRSGCHPSIEHVCLGRSKVQSSKFNFLCSTPTLLCTSSLTEFCLPLLAQTIPTASLPNDP